MIRKLLLICGIVAALLYVGSDILAAMRWEGYSYTAQSVSELRAIGAPTRALLVPILTLYSVLELAFGLGVWGAAAHKWSPKRALRVTGALLIGLAVIDLVVAPFFQLNLAKSVGALANTMHVVLTALTVLLILLIIGFGANADGKWFRFYSYATLAVLILTGALAFLDLPQIAAQMPTPWLGVRERINIYGYMLWTMVLALTLLRAESTVAGKPPASIGAPQLTPH
jgi:hypothetical protein